MKGIFVQLMSRRAPECLYRPRVSPDDLNAGSPGNTNKPSGYSCAGALLFADQEPTQSAAEQNDEMIQSSSVF